MNKIPGTEKPNRRTVLQAAGALVTSSVFAGPVQGESSSAQKPQKSIGKKQFVEVAVEHENLPESNVLNFDPMIQYKINPNSQAMALNHTVSTDTIKQFKQNNGLVSMGIIPTYHPLGSKIREPSRKSVRIDSTRRLQIWSEYTPPSIQVEQSNQDSIRASVGSNVLDVEPGTTGEIRLEDTEVGIRKRNGEYIKVETRDGKTTEVQELGPIESKTITPVVKIANHGALDVFHSKEVTQ